MRPRNKIYNVGINDAPYETVSCPYYMKWKNMMSRIYRITYKGIHSVTSDDTVCNDWIHFTGFLQWAKMECFRVNLPIEALTLVSGLAMPITKVWDPLNCALVPRDCTGPFKYKRRNTILPIGVSSVKTPTVSWCINLGIKGDRERNNPSLKVSTMNFYDRRAIMFYRLAIDPQYVTITEELRRLGDCYSLSPTIMVSVIEDLDRWDRVGFYKGLTGDRGGDRSSRLHQITSTLLDDPEVVLFGDTLDTTVGTVTIDFIFWDPRFLRVDVTNKRVINLTGVNSNE